MKLDKKPKEVLPPKTPTPPAAKAKDPNLVEDKGTDKYGSSLYYNRHLDVWSVSFSFPGTIDTWIAMPNEKIARGAYAGGPPYEETDGTAPVSR